MKYKIAYLIRATDNSGGMERVLSNKTKYLVNAGYDVTIITTDQQSKSSFFEFSDKVKFIDLDINYSNLYTATLFKKIRSYFYKKRLHKKRLTQLLMSNKYDVVISMYGNEVQWLMGIQDGSKKILEIHFSKFFRLQAERKGLLGIFDKYRTSIEERIVGHYDSFVLLSNEDRQYWPQYKNISVIYNSAPVVNNDTLSLNNKRAIAVGRLTFQKGFNHLVDIWAIVNKQHPDWHLDIYGSGEDYDALSAQIESQNLKDVISINKPTTNINLEMLKSSIYLMTSNYEGLPMVLLESMSYGVPCVAFTCKCGPRDIITDGIDGCLIDGNNYSDFALRVCELIGNQNMRIAMGNAARKKMTTEFSCEVIMKQWEDLFYKLLNE